MKVAVYNIQGESTGREIELPDSVFGLEPNEHAVYLAVKQYLAHQRQGTHKSKDKGEITGSTRKLKRQKGTGTARSGSIKSPVFRGGGRVFGPRPHRYNIKLNKKLKALARNSALSDKVSREKGLVVVEDFSFEGPKTKAYLDILSNLQVNDRKSLVVTSEYDKNVYLSGRNVPYSKTVAASDLNTYTIMNTNSLVLTEGAVAKISELFA
jgi:large subunit ribosomal protein L4